MFLNGNTSFFWQQREKNIFFWWCIKRSKVHKFDWNGESRMIYSCVARPWSVIWVIFFSQWSFSLKISIISVHLYLFVSSLVIFRTIFSGFFSPFYEIWFKTQQFSFRLICGSVKLENWLLMRFMHWFISFFASQFCDCA